MRWSLVHLWTSSNGLPGSLFSRKRFNCGLPLNLIVRGAQLKEPFAKFVKTALGSGTLLITCGLPGTWKTETSEEISKIKGYPILRSDLIRLEVLRNEDVFDVKVASNMRKRLSVYDEMFRRAEDLARKGKQGVILDATFVTQELRRRAAEIAARHGMTLVILQTSCPEEVSIARISRRTKENYESNALTVEAYLDNKKKFEPVDLDDLKKRHPRLQIVHLTVDTCHDSPKDWYVIGMQKR
jgi:predicted kinase